MNTCRAFEMSDETLRNRHLRNLVRIEEFGDFCSGHWLHTWDDGHRFLCRCPECDALVLVQSSEYHGEEDSYYDDYFSVSSREEAIFLNENFDGFQIEMKDGLKRIFRTF